MLDWTTGTVRWNTAHSLIEKVMIRAHYFKIKRLACQTTRHHILEKKKSRSPLFVDRISPTSAPSSKGRQKSAPAICTIGKRNLIELLIVSCYYNLRQHILFASYMDIFFGVENTPLYPRNIPDVATFQMNARGSAVNDNDHVIIYENTGKFGFFLGARAWWMFKVCEAT